MMSVVSVIKNSVVSTVEAQYNEVPTFSYILLLLGLLTKKTARTELT